ncbi:MAG: hypothetical protein K9N46_12190 [Candidatus Marinimicrobia bacterium]|nr:hypothetical protein [Candidatus Neomarinimicrobiota bacterium]MCF7829111.1 hypothetical protein [Candidatus Neomarinimicrobiota bacterium]MCF7881490.1 hypothetical protein [Candidatus Neomarinimicrobiota bacterium]
MKRVTTLSFGLVILAFLVLTGCQSSLTGPDVDASTAQGLSMKAVNVSPNIMGSGLAKESLPLSHSRMITAKEGGRLGGTQTGGNFVEIPAGALEEYGNLYMTLKIYIDDDVTLDENTPPQKVLIFEITGREHKNGDAIEEIYLDGTATVAVSRDWLEDAPTHLVNVENTDDSNVVDVDSEGDFYTVEVTHFSKWSWVILE